MHYPNLACPSIVERHHHLMLHPRAPSLLHVTICRDFPPYFIHYIPYSESIMISYSDVSGLWIHFVYIMVYKLGTPGTPFPPTHQILYWHARAHVISCSIKKIFDGVNALLTTSTTLFHGSIYKLLSKTLSPKLKPMSSPCSS